MKSLIYILLAVLLSGMFVSSLPKSISNQKQVVTIQSVDKSPNTNLFDKSCSIIKNRLKDYGLQNFEVSVNATQKTIGFTFTDKVDVNEILPLMVSKGKIELYETFDRLDVIKLLEKDDKLYSLLNIPLENPEIDHSSAIVGYCKVQNKSQVDSYIANLAVTNPAQGIKYLWGVRPTVDGSYTLYSLKPQAAMDKFHLLETLVVKRSFRLNASF